MTHGKGIYGVWACFLALAALLVLSLARVALHRRSAARETWTACRAQTRAAADAMDRALTADAGLVAGIAQDLEAGRLEPDGLPARLEAALAKAPARVSSVGVLFQPYAAGPSRRFLGPHVLRDGQRTVHVAFEASGDYTQLPWYQGGLGRTGWNEPHLDPATGQEVVDFSQSFRLPGASAPSGLVRLELTPQGIQELVESLAFDHAGYGFLLSGKGIFLADPVEARVRDQVHFETEARQRGDAGRLHLALSAQAQRADFTETDGSLSGQRLWMFVEPIPGTTWSLGTRFIKGELDLVPYDHKGTLGRLVILGTGSALAALWLFLHYWRPQREKPWLHSAGIAFILAAGTGFLWHFAYTLEVPAPAKQMEVMSRSTRDAFIKEHPKLGSGLAEVPASFIPTGVYIQQLERSGDSRMTVSGQVWEKVPKELPEEARGFLFPEAVSVDVGRGIAKQEGDMTILVYPFKGVFLMATDWTEKYPFDRSSVRLQIWPRRFYDNVVLVPDLESYTLLAPMALPGMAKGLELPGWKLQQSRFDFINESYNTNFGIEGMPGQQESPELDFTFTMNRNFLTPFIATFLPILVVAGLLFALLITTTPSRERASATGYNAFNVLRSVISLFFPVVVAQINLRNHILTQGLLFVEYYYFVAYVLVLLVAVNSLAVAFLDCQGLLRNENRLSKVLFWPVLTAAFFGISMLYLS